MANKIFVSEDGNCKMSYDSAATVPLIGGKSKIATDVEVGDILTNSLGFALEVATIEDA